MYFKLCWRKLFFGGILMTFEEEHKPGPWISINLSKFVSKHTLRLRCHSAFDIFLSGSMPLKQNMANSNKARKTNTQLLPISAVSKCQQNIAFTKYCKCKKVWKASNIIVLLYGRTWTYWMSKLSWEYTFQNLYIISSFFCIECAASAIAPAFIA